MTIMLSEKFLKLQEQMLMLRKECSDRGEKMFMGIPERWYDKPGPLYRCENEHISRMLLKSEAKGMTVCLDCYGPVLMTFPEDVDGAFAPQLHLDALDVMRKSEEEYDKKIEEALDKDRGAWLFNKDKY